jgi:hypothetical protein
MNDLSRETELNRANGWKALAICLLIILGIYLFANWVESRRVNQINRMYRELNYMRYEKLSKDWEAEDKAEQWMRALPPGLSRESREKHRRDMEEFYKRY